MRDAGGKPIDYDGNFVLDSGRDLRDPVAAVTSPDGDLTLKLWTDRPGLQFYNALTTNVPVPGLDGKTYGKYSGFCLEDQAFPDARASPAFPQHHHHARNALFALVRIRDRVGRSSKRCEPSSVSSSRQRCRANLARHFSWSQAAALSSTLCASVTRCE